MDWVEAEFELLSYRKFSVEEHFATKEIFLNRPAQ